MKDRIFAKRIKKFVTVELEVDHTKAEETAYLTLLEDGTHPSLTMKWTLTGRQAIAAALSALKARSLSQIMDAVEGITGELPLMQDDNDGAAGASPRAA